MLQKLSKAELLHPTWVLVLFC